MQVSVGYSENPDSNIAAREATQAALTKVNRNDICDMVLLFSTSNHDQQILRAEVAELTGNSHAIYGGGAVGIITNDAFGYAGDQVGVACLWLEESSCKVVVENELSRGEFDKGEALGKQLADLAIEPNSSIMLFYDAMKAIPDGAGMIMATWLLQGLEKGLGYLPDINGAGLQGDFWGGITSQYVGDRIVGDTAIAMAFSEDVCIDSVIMHGCHPASPYYKVTKADGPMILEINGEPALPFIDNLVGSALKPEQYPFFLLFGINHGERWGEYDEDNYASRLCLGIAPECNGIVMLEPDMVEGTEFQLMFRSLDMDYMPPKIDSLFDKLDGREPVFAIYINCAGRCAGYNGVDVEDAYVIQKALGAKIPLLGLYTGVEISEIGGKPRGLDWTGVLCLFSIKRAGEDNSQNHKVKNVWDDRVTDNSKDEAVSVDAVLKLCQQNAAKVLELDTQSIMIRNELELKRRGFRLLSELSATLHRDEDNDEILKIASKRINSTLNMQRTIVLLPDSDGGYLPVVMQGYSEEEKKVLLKQSIMIDEKLFEAFNPVIATGADEGYLAELRSALKIRYFVLAPVVVENEVMAVLITGRMVETPPFLARLGGSDIENVQAISTLLASVLVYERLDTANKRASTDVVTGLLNRGAMEAKVAAQLIAATKDDLFALIIIDFDRFKQVNDTYGHLVGDVALKALADALNRNFRSGDLIARIGGDEFVVFCSFTGTPARMTSKVADLIARWDSTPITTEDGVAFYATLSIGVAIAPRDGDTYEELFAKADLALYQAKEKGRDQYQLYDNKMSLIGKTMSDSER